MKDIVKSCLAALAFLYACVLMSCIGENPPQYVVTSDIDNFWKAYDKIIATQDTLEQAAYLEDLFLKPGTAGLKAFMARKEYTAAAYLDAIRKHPKFWTSVRANTERASQFAGAIEQEVEKLHRIYPDLKPAKIYFTIGAMRSNGTTLNDMVLIGAELALADSTTVSEELEDWLQQSLSVYFASNPIDDVVLLNAHEYVHTQQSGYGTDLLAQCMYEGVAEFVSVVSSGKPSAAPAVAFGQSKAANIRKRFALQVGSPHWNDWLYNDLKNEFGVRDLGYYVGYAIAEKYYKATNNKKAAIKRLIELDYGNPKELEVFVDETGYFTQRVAALQADYAANQPSVSQIENFENGAQNIDPNLREITLVFSTPLNPRFRNQRIGPLGVDFVLPVKGIDFAPDGKTITYTVELEVNRQYQLQLTDQFRDLDGRTLKPYLLDFKTSAN